MAETFIIDEWLWSDLNGDNGKERQKEAVNFLKALFEKCDKIAVAKYSKFQEKEWDFSKKAHLDIVKHKIAKFYFFNIRLNSQKYEEVDIEDINNKEEIDVRNINRDDVYLVRTYHKVNALIITTDTKLKNILDDKNIQCKLRDKFLGSYINTCNGNSTILIE